MRWRVAILFIFSVLILKLASSLVSSPVSVRSQILATLQGRANHEQILEHVAPLLTPANDPDGTLASLILVRLSKLLVTLDNTKNGQMQLLFSRKEEKRIRRVASLLGESFSCGNNLESLVEGTKAYAVLLRLLQGRIDETSDPLLNAWCRHAHGFALEPHQLTGIRWAFDTLGMYSNVTLPLVLQQAYTELSIPFVVYPGMLQNMSDLSVDSLSQQVDFGVDNVYTSSNRVVKERRQTAWQGDEKSCGSFPYSGKSMPRQDWSPIVRNVRDELWRTTQQYYNGCLLNLYADGKSGMRYHSDPDQGVLWDYDTAVVSVGATRRFAFRAKEEKQPHNFLVMHGDVTHMFHDCQDAYQHTVKKASSRHDTSPRASLVFKRTWQLVPNQMR